MNWSQVFIFILFSTWDVSYRRYNGGGGGGGFILDAVCVCVLSVSVCLVIYCV